MSQSTNFANLNAIPAVDWSKIGGFDVKVDNIQFGGFVSKHLYRSRVKIDLNKESETQVYL